MVQELRIVLKNQGKIDPLAITDYLKVGGYDALLKSRKINPIIIIDEIQKSGLRGRGGAGFNSGMKLSFAYNTKSDEKYLVCNADEGEPGTYKDRIIMENDPHSLIEGMAICAHAIGSNKGFIYCRAEYPKSIEILTTAVDQAKEKGVLENFTIKIRTGAGSYVCGEETALIESLEGHRGEPRFRPPYPPVSGLWGKPTIVNNVETFANIPQIISNGSKWFSSIGDPDYPGTKVVTLSGDVKLRTYFEVPTDTTVKDVIFGLAGGMAENKPFKSVLVGGNSGGFIPESLLDTKINFDSLAKVGATLGSGAMLVLNTERDMVDVVLRISEFFEHESCGNCSPCREGTMRLHDLLNKINSGNGTYEDFTLIEKLSRVMEISCLCGLGQGAPLPIKTAIEHFGPEFYNKIKRQVI